MLIYTRDIPGLRNVDVVAWDREERIVLLADVSARRSDADEDSGLRRLAEDLGPVFRAMGAAGAPVPYGMAVNLDRIHIVQYELEPPRGHDLAGPPDSWKPQSIVGLKTPEMLGHYDPEFANKTIYYHYLAGLTASWLRDLAYHWKSETPPGTEELRQIGLLPLLEGGTASSEPWSDDDPLP